MTRYLDKIIKNGDERCFQGSGDVDVSGMLFFGSGCDGACTISRDTTIQARTYEFTTLNICPDVKLSFCGTGIPNIKATECINNQGTIDLRSTYKIYSCQVNFAFIGCVCNIPHRSGRANIEGTCGQSFNCKGGSGSNAAGGCRGGGYGQDGYSYSNEYKPKGGCSYGPNGGGGAGYYRCDDYDEYYARCANGGNANELCGGKGGNGVGDDDSRYCAGGGGGGFGMYGGGNGGNGDQGGGGGSGGNSYYGKAGNGGNGSENSYYDNGTDGGDGGDSLYGDAGHGGTGGGANNEASAGSGGKGGCSVWGNGGNGGAGGNANDHRGGAGGDAGCSLYGNGGNGGSGGTSSYCPAGAAQRGGDSLGGQYGLVLASKNIYNNCIIGCGGNGGCGGTGRNNVRGGDGGHGADVHILYRGDFHCGEICNCAGCGGYGTAGCGEPGIQGALCICKIIL